LDHMNAQQNNRSLGELLTDVSRGISDLIRKEMALGRAELSEKVQQMGAGIAALGAGGAIVLIGLFLIFQALVFGVSALLQFWVSEAVAEWLAPLLVGLIAVLVGWVLLAKGRSNLRPENLAPQRITDSLRQDAKLVKEQVR
jgi:hypothetical protein